MKRDEAIFIICLIETDWILKKKWNALCLDIRHDLQKNTFSG